MTMQGKFDLLALIRWKKNVVFPIWANPWCVLWYAIPTFLQSTSDLWERMNQPHESKEKIKPKWTKLSLVAPEPNEWQELYLRNTTPRKTTKKASIVVTGNNKVQSFCGNMPAPRGGLGKVEQSVKQGRKKSEVGSNNVRRHYVVKQDIR